RRVERGRLAASRRPGHQNHAEGPGNRFLEVVERRFLEAELRHVELQARLVEQAQYDLLAENGGNYRHSEIHLFRVGKTQLDSSILRQSTLRDVQCGHYLQPREQRIFQLERRLHDLVQHAVDAEAYAQHLFEGLDVDVAGTLADRVGEQRIDELDDWRFLGRALELLEIDLLVLANDLD